MNARNILYTLEIHQLARSYRGAESLQNATRLHSYESATAFGPFHVGDTLSHTFPSKYLGRIQHVHHWVGEGEGPHLVHRTMLYLFNES